MNRREIYLCGVKSALPIIFGFVPVAIAYAIMAAQAGLTSAETVLMSVLVFAGASQIMAVGMLSGGAGMAAIIIATLILNCRHIIMSTCVFNRMKDGKLWQRIVAAFGVTDESFAIYTTIDDDKCSIIFLAGIITVTYGSWVIGTVIGTFANGFLPEMVSNSLGIALYALFIALLVPNIRRNIRLGILVIITAIINYILQHVMAPSWALIVSALLCAGIGVFTVDNSLDEYKQ